MAFFQVILIINWLIIGWKAETKLWRILPLFGIMLHTFVLTYQLNIIGTYKSPLDIRWEVYHCQKDLPAYQNCIITVSRPNEKK